MLIDDFDGLAAQLQSWEAVNGRDLPWRRRRDAYGLVVAEVLLQQTVAASVVPVWSNVLAHYSRPEDFLAAPDKDLLQLIRQIGLGNQRVTRLREAVGAAVAGSEPLPGLGPYGQAVLAMAQGRPRTTTPVDANVARVVCRVAGLGWERGEPRRKREVLGFVDRLLGSKSPEGQLQTLYALLDVAAAVCRARTTSCSLCPVASSCASSTASEPSATMMARPRASARSGGTQSDTSLI